MTIPHDPAETLNATITALSAVIFSRVRARISGLPVRIVAPAVGELVNGS
jgi:hypothetical protein